MNNYELSNFTEYSLYPAMWERIDALFPQMEFKWKSNRWESCHHLDGKRDSTGKAVSYVYQNRKFCAIDHSRDENKSLISLYMEQECKDFRTAIDALAARCGLTSPSFDSDEWREYQKKQSGREEACRTFVRSLRSDTEEARKVLSYLYSRKWTKEDIEKAGLGLATTEIIQKLKDRDEFKSKPTKTEAGVVYPIGTTHILSIPYRNGERILGFKFREIGANTGDKYLNTVGLQKSRGFFGIGIKIEDVAIVEGELDALHAQVRGADYVVATTGGAATATQIEDAVKRGTKRITLLFDNDERGQGFILPTIEAAEKFGVDVFVASIPDGYKDTDEFLGEKTIDDFNGIVNNAIPACLWRYRKAVEKYTAIEDEQRKQCRERGEEEIGLTFKQREDFLKEIAGILNAPNLKRYDRTLVFNEMENIEDCLQFDLKEFRASVDSEYNRKREKARTDEITASSCKIQAALEKGDTDGAVKIMAETASKDRIKDKSDEYAKVFSPLSPQKASEIIAGIKDGIPTGYKFSQGKRCERLTLNTGLTFICGYRGHGKTSFLNNIALNEARRNLSEGNGQSVLYFSYEVDKRRLLADLLNTFVNDKELSANPVETIISYFKGNGSRYFRNEFLSPDFKLPEGYFPQGTRPETVLHFDYFERAKDVFFRDYLSSGALIVVDENYKVEELLEAVKYEISLRPTSVICLDYAQLIYSSEYSRLRTEEIKRVVNDIKDFANKEGIPFVMAAQFNRDVDSPVSVDTKNIGEGGDFERIADTCVGLYNLKELHPLPRNKEEEKSARALLKGLGIETGDELKPIYGKLFVRLMKRRYGDYPLDTVLDWEGRTKYITPNDNDTEADSLPEAEEEEWNGF